MRDDLLSSWAPDPLEGETDDELIQVFRELERADPTGDRIGRLMRSTLDQLYDGQRTGRYSWEQLHKTERTHFGTLFEINLRREFDDVIDEGEILDYNISGIEVDCKFSQRMHAWMIPPEALGHLLVVGYVNDRDEEFAFGVVRATSENCRTSQNRDAKVQLNQNGRESVRWIQRPGQLPPNVLLRCRADAIEAIFSPRSGQKRVNELFRRVQGQRIGRSAIAAVAQQDDFMKRVRANGGARTHLQPEGIIILGGDYDSQRRAAELLGVDVPRQGEFVSIRVTPAEEFEPFVSFLDGRYWRVASETDPVVEAPRITSRS